MKKSRMAVLQSVLSILLSISLFVGTTFAWFTQSVTSDRNIIQSGNIDLEMYWADDPVSGPWYNVEDDAYNTIFSYDNWEPGYSEIKYIKLVNKGNLALNYEITLTPEGNVGKLAEVIGVRFVKSGEKISTREEFEKLSFIGLLKNVMNGGATASGTLLPNGEQSLTHPSGETIVTIGLQMLTTAGNEYQNQSVGDGFSITALASQCAYESDSFGSDYDQQGTFDEVLRPTAGSVTVVPENGKVPAGGAVIDTGTVSVIIPEGTVLADGEDTLSLKITPLESTTSDITVVNDEILIPVDVHVDGISDTNDVPLIINLGPIMPKYLNIGNYTLIHVENGVNNIMTLVDDVASLNAHNQFTYNPVTGDVTVAMASFSEVAIVADTEKGWEGNYDYSWYTTAVALADGESSTEYIIANADQLAAFGKIVGGMANGFDRDSFAGKTVKLISDINLGYENGSNKYTIFHPIGYSYIESDSTVKSFEGTFDGNGHTIANFYQNTWEIKGDYDGTYYKDAMGLFGYVYGGTVKNLTVDNFSSDGEFTPTGVIAAYAAGDSTFENIAITHCNPRVYNTGNGGIIGIAGDTSANDDDHITLKNITVDNSNKISALWGSWDVACGGLVGMYRGNVDANGEATGDTISFENCHVAAQIDVYNDVCANYQYYAYRYAGMIIGSVRHNTTNADGKTIPNMTGISAKGCTVNYGDWNDYYYCEFEKNTMASYSEDYQFSRVPHSELNFTDKNGNGVIDADERSSVTGCKHVHTAEENHQAVYLPFHQLFTGYSWGVSSIGLEKYSGIVTDLGITEGDKEESDEKFETKFTGDFLYRVGNQNAVSVGSLFKAKDGVTITRDGVWVTVEKLDENMNVSGTYTANTTDWTKGTIKFEGTGVVKVTIQDYNFCTPTVLMLEVVDAKNYAAETISSLGSGNVVLLNNTKLNNNGALALQNATLYGNGFEIDVSAGRTTGESISANYLLYMNNAILDNAQIRGAVYTDFDIISSNSWNNPVVLSVGNSKIANSYISNCASPVRIRAGKLEIINSTLKGGFFANLDVRGGNVTLDNVTTINQANLNDKSADGKEVVGLGVVVYYEGPTKDTTITVKNNLTQYNYLENKQTSNSYANVLIDEIFGSGKYDTYTDANGKKWANTGIVSLSSAVGKDNILTDKQTNKGDFKGGGISYNHPQEGYVNGYLYSSNPGICDSYNYSPDTQYEIIPKVSLDHSVNEHIKQEGSETSCTSDINTGVETITFADGDSFEWNVNILKCSNKSIDYTVWMDGKQYTDKIVFNETGEHTVTFKYRDVNNFRKNSNGEIEKYTVEYNVSMVIVVNEMAATAKNAEITFPLLDSYGTTKTTVDGKTYIMPNLTGTNIPKYGDDLSFDASKRQYGSLKADGKTSVDIYYPIIKTAISGNYMVFPVFGNKNGTLVQIQDYADNGTGAALTPYNASTKSLPSGLSVSRGYTVQWSTDKNVAGSGSMSYGGWTNGVLAFKYQSSSDDIACKEMSNYLSYYPNINLRSNDRNEQVMVAEYKYVDAKGDTFYYCVGYHIEKRNNGYAFGETVPEQSSGCITPDTLITLADGSQVRVDSLTGEEELLVWNLETGKYDTAPIVFVDSESEEEYEIIHLYFSDGYDVKVIYEHGFFDLDLAKYVYIDAHNYADYIGHRFVTEGDIAANNWNISTLDNVVIEKEVTTAWSPVTFEHLCYYTNGVLSMPGGIAGLFNIFDVDTEIMSYDAQKMQNDIATYGLFTLDDFGGMIPEIAFEAFNGDLLKVAIAKGLLTWEDIAYMAERYIPLM